MNNDIIGKILYFWIFLIGGLFIARVLGYANDGRTIIIFCVALAGVYTAFQVGRSMRKKKLAEKEAEKAASSGRRSGSGRNSYTKPSGKSGKKSGKRKKR